MVRPKRRRSEEDEQEEQQDDEVLPDSQEGDAAGAPQQQSDGDEPPEAEDDGEDAAAAAAGPSSSKQARLEYPRGTVKKVRVCNIMTYGSPPVTITPGPRLNLVLGPNGTGKSSLVCALCLGLTGSPKLLGRADSLKDFVRRGAASGWVETTLSGGGRGARDVVVRCEVDKTGEGGYTTRWRINNTPCPMKDVRELVAGMNIQFDNLCQFLPQDKVVEFARLDAHELLVATEKAIGDASLADTHAALIGARAGMRGKQQEREALAAQHSQLVADNASLERDYARFEQRAALEADAARIRAKLAWLRVYDAQAAARSADEEERAAKAALREAEAASKGDERPAKRCRAAADAARARFDALQADLKKKNTAAEKALDRLGREEGEAQRLRGELEGLELESQKQKESVATLVAKLDKARAAMAALPPAPDHSARIAELAAEQGAINEQLHSLEGERMSHLSDLNQAKKEAADLQAELRQCGTASYQRLQAIVRAAPRNSLTGLEGMAEWVARARTDGRTFQGPVVGPLGCEVAVRAPAHAQYLENAIFQQLANFAVTCRADERTLTNELRRRSLERCRVIVVAGDLSAALPNNSAALRAHGVDCCLDEVYDAPPLVRHALANTSYLDSIYVMSGARDLSAVRSFMESHNVKQVYTPQANVRYIESLYGGRAASSLQTRDLFPARVLGGSEAAGEVEEKRQALTARLVAASARVSELEARLQQQEAQRAPLERRGAALADERQALNSQTRAAADQRSKLMRSLKSGEALLAQQQAVPDPLSKAPGLRDGLAASLECHYKALCDMLAAQAARWALLQDATLAELEMREADMQAKALAAAIQAQRSALTALTAAHKAAHARARIAVAAYQDAQRDAAEEHPLDDAAKAALAALSDDRSQLLASLAALEQQVDAINVNNPRVAQEYRARKAAIEAKAASLASLDAALAADADEVERLKAAWLPELTRVVSAINASFSTNFAQIGCAGEVSLGCEGDDYERYAVNIRVKFREGEELTPLTAHRQSGGERSVSTIMYLIALQGVTVTPFRVVDEINQGMDPTNERRVFEQLVSAACAPGTPQCFLLTPKLLPDLPFTRDITVLNIFNGTSVPADVRGTYTFGTLVGSRGMAALVARGVRVAG